MASKPGFENCGGGATAGECARSIAFGAAVGAAIDVATLGAGHALGFGLRSTVGRIVTYAADADSIVARALAAPGLRQLEE